MGFLIFTTFYLVLGTENNWWGFGLTVFCRGFERGL